MKNSAKYDRVVFWLKKDETLTNFQLRELTQASDNLISKARKALGIQQVLLPATHREVDLAFKKFLQKRGKELGVRKNFNPSYNPSVPEKG